MDNVGNNGENNDAEKALDRHIEELERQRAQAADKAIQEGKAAELAQRLERERDAGVAAIQSVIEATKVHFHVLPAKVYELLLENDLEVTAEGIAKLVHKFPGLANGNTTKKLLAGVVSEQDEQPKPKKRSDFPATKSEFPQGWAGAELKSAFVDAFGFDEWQALPNHPIVLKDTEKLTREEFNRLTSTQKFEISKKLEAKGDSMGEYLKRIARNH